MKSLAIMGDFFTTSARERIFRITHDPAPRLLYIFDFLDARSRDRAPALLERVQSGDIPASELTIGGAFGRSDAAQKIATLARLWRRASESPRARLRAA